MSKPAVVKTWQYAQNNRVVNSTTMMRDLMLGLKNALISFASFPWIIDSCCGGGVAGVAGDGVDRWLITTNLVYASSAGTAHSWMVLKQPGITAGFQLCIDLITTGGGGAAYYNANIYVSGATGFTGGTTTARPTAADEAEITQSNSWTLNSNTTPLVYHVTQSDDGECTRVFVLRNGNVVSFWLLDKIQGVRAPQTTPYVAVVLSNSSTTLEMTMRASLTNAAGARVRLGATTGNAYLSGQGAFSQLVSSLMVNHDDVADECYLSPVNVWSTTAGARGCHGQLADFWWGPAVAKNGTTHDAMPTLVTMGDGAVIPSNGVAFRVRG